MCQPVSGEHPRCRESFIFEGQVKDSSFMNVLFPQITFDFPIFERHYSSKTITSAPIHNSQPLLPPVILQPLLRPITGARTMRIYMKAFFKCFTSDFPSFLRPATAISWYFRFRPQKFRHFSPNQKNCLPCLYTRQTGDYVSIFLVLIQHFENKAYSKRLKV